jgi:hypothetical protein
MSEWKLEGETFIYELNQEGSNKWCLNIQPGWSDNGQKLGPEDISDVIDLVLSAKKLQAENAKLRKERDELQARIVGGIRMHFYKKDHAYYAVTSNVFPANATLIVDEGAL